MTQEPTADMDCRAERSGISSVALCLTKQAFQCKFAKGFSSGYFCLHPEHFRIVGRTESPLPA